MLNLIRRISSSVVPRPDRPWEDDPTSNAPTRRKRRISTIEREAAGDDEQTTKKKLRSEDLEIFGSDDTPSSPIVPAAIASGITNEDTADEPTDTIQREGSLEVKVVTKGVNEVELEDKRHSSNDVPTASITNPEKAPEYADETIDLPNTCPSNTEEETSTTVNPAAIPLPEDEADELDEIPGLSRIPHVSVPDSEDSVGAIAPDSSEPDAPLKADNDNETLATYTPSRPETPRQNRSSRSSVPSSAAKKLRSKSPKKVSARA